MRKSFAIIIVLLLIGSSYTYAKTYYFRTLVGVVEAPSDSGPFTTKENGEDPVSLDVTLAFSSNSLYITPDSSGSTSYSLSGADADAVTLSLISDNESFLSSDDINIDTDASTITIPSSATSVIGTVNLTILAKDSGDNTVATDNLYINITPLSADNILTKWTVSAGQTVRFPFNNSYFTSTYSGHIDWGDGSDVKYFNNVTIQSLSHTYANAGTYDIRIDGGFFNATSIYRMFNEVTIPSGFNINNWDTSSVTNMSYSLWHITIPDGFNINGWDTSNVTTMREMFYYSTLPASLDLSDWDVSKVSTMEKMFSYAKIPDGFSFNGWNPASVTNTNSMFSSTTFYGDITYDKTVSPEIYSNFIKMLSGIISVSNKKIYVGDNTCPVGDSACTNAETTIEGKGWILVKNKTIDESSANKTKWTVSAGQTVRFPFYKSTPEIIVWGDGSNDTGTVYQADLKVFSHTYTDAGTYTILSTNDSWKNDLSYMFYQKTIPSGLDITSWDTSNVTTMYRMFNETTIPSGFNINNWDTSSVTNMSYSLWHITIPDGFNINGWDTSNVTTMREMFYYSTLPASLDLSDWDVSKVSTMEKMFSYAKIPDGFSFNGWNPASVTNTNNMFSSTTFYGDITYDKTVSPEIYSNFMKMLSGIISVSNKKIYVGDNVCPVGDSACTNAEATIEGKGWIITRTVAE